MEKELMTLSFAFVSPTNFEFRLACEHGSCASLINILSSTVALVFVFICFVLAFCLMCYINGFKYGLKYKGDEQTSIHIDSTDKSIPKENNLLLSAKYRRKIRKSVSKEFDPVCMVHKVIVGEVQGHPSTTCLTNPVPAQSRQIKSHSNVDIMNTGRRGQRNPNRFRTRAEDFVKCSAAKNCVTTDADSPVISISSDKTDVREGLRGQCKHNRFRTRAADIAPCTDAKFFLPSNAESPDTFESRDKAEVRGGHKRQRQPNIFSTLAADLAPCTDAKVCIPSNADSPTSFVSGLKMDVRGGSSMTFGCKRRISPIRFHTRAADLVPCNDAKVVLPSHADNPGRTISRDKTDVRGEELQVEEELETASDDTENESSKQEEDSDIQTDSDCINDPYGDSGSFFLDLETDAIPSDEPTEKDETKDYGLNSDMEPGKCVQNRGRHPRSQQYIPKNKKCQMRKRKRSYLSSAKRSGETFIKGEYVMIGKNNRIISTEDCKCKKLDDLKQTFDGLSARIYENSMKFGPLMQKLDGLSAMVFEFSGKPNCSQSVYAERGIFAVPCNYVQNVASAASKFRHCYECCSNTTSAEGLCTITSKYDTVEMTKKFMTPHNDPCSSNVQSEHCDHISGTETDTNSHLPKFYKNY